MWPSEAQSFGGRIYSHVIENTLRKGHQLSLESCADGFNNAIKIKGRSKPGLIIAMGQLSYFLLVSFTMSVPMYGIVASSVGQSLWYSVVFSGMGTVIF